MRDCFRRSNRSYFAFCSQARLHNGYTISSDILISDLVVSGVQDTWKIPVITDESPTATSTFAGLSSKPAKAALNGKPGIVPAALGADDIGDVVAAQLGGLDKVFAGYDVTSNSDGFLEVKAADAGNGTVTKEQLVLTIEDYALNPLGYTIAAGEHDVGVQSNAGTPISEIIGKQPGIGANSTIVSTGLDKTISVTYDGKTDWTIIAAATAALSGTELNLELTGSGVESTSSGATFTIQEKTSHGLDGFAVGGTALADVFGTGVFVQGAAASNPTAVEGSDSVYRIVITGGGASSDLIPTVSSVVTLAATGSGNLTFTPASGKVVIKAGTTHTDIVSAVSDMTSRTYATYTRTTNIIHSNFLTEIVYTKDTSPTATFGDLTGITPSAVAF